MPLHPFHCNDCANDFEALVRSSDTEAKTCPACGSANLQQMVSRISKEITYHAIAKGWRRQAYKEGDMSNVSASELKRLGAKPMTDAAKKRLIEP